MPFRYQRNIYNITEMFIRNERIQVSRFCVIPYPTFIYEIKVLLEIYALF